MLYTPTIAVLVLVAFFIFSEDIYVSLFEVFKYPPYHFPSFVEGGYPYLFSVLMKSMFIWFAALVLLIQFREWRLVKDGWIRLLVNVAKKMRFVNLGLTVLMAVTAVFCFSQYEYPSENEDWLPKTATHDRDNFSYSSNNFSTPSFSETSGDNTDVYYLEEDIYFEILHDDIETKEWHIFVYKDNFYAQALQPFGDYSFLRYFIVSTCLFIWLSQLTRCGFAAARQESK